MYSTSSIMENGMSMASETDFMSSMLAASFAVLGVVMILMGVFALIMIISQWRLFKKAGQPGWAAIVPFYGSVILSKVAGVNIWFYLGILIATVVGSFVPAIATIATIANFVWMIVIAFKLPEKFGKGAGFGVGLWLLPFIFYPILAFGKSEYQG